MASTALPTGSNTSSIRQSARQTRTNPSRISKTISRTSTSGLFGIGPGSGSGAGQHSFSHPHHHHLHHNSSLADSSSSVANNPNNPSIPHGMYPAITHFSDAVAALPREFRRHASLLKEVDGKAWAMEDELSKQLDVASAATPYYRELHGLPKINYGNENGNGKEGATQQPKPIDLDAYESPEARTHRNMFYNLRATLSELMITADEKNHVLWNANSELEKQLHRLEAIYPYVQGEVSEEARLGSLTHWAYASKTKAKTAGGASERPRRETAATNNQNTSVTVEPTRKQRRNQVVDPDADEPRPSRKTGAGKQARGAGGDAGANEMLTGVPSAPAKRRRVDKGPQGATSAPMERSVSATTAVGRGASKEAPAVEAVKKRIRAPNAGTAGRKSRTNTITSAAGSPSLVASPVVPSPNLAAKAASPAPSALQRPQSSRAQQTSQAGNGRQRPSSSASNRNPNTSTFPGPGSVPLEASNNNPLPIVEKGVPDSKVPPIKDSAAPKVESAAGPIGEDTNKSRPSSRATDQGSKREGSITSNHNAPSKGEKPQVSEIMVPPPAPKGRSSKTSTPVSSTFSETQQPQRTRPSRTTDGGPSKRSSKKGAAAASLLTAHQQLIAAAAEDEDSSRQGDDEDDESEQRYCYCNQVSFGDMVACDMENCPREWFHLSCVGLSKPPSKSAKWYCNECKERLKG
ncbi:hypothetical protein AJ80_07025 [Polytolypa hystricis UAMH7299]|uniref:Chromatin modification-related protein n=1 Tax=Polytolypa hystricis (strain UAMH7299) TaxID=1447883 RepID=A0A2B7XST0_POLH7|nr:hypothetical protein AJ80_07025 [Polytolypa hystricis UAMH7299]